MVDKRYVKMGIAGAAALALVIGLSVGLSQKNAANRSASASLNMGMGGMYADECFEEVAPAMAETTQGGGRGGKSGKGGKGSKSRRAMMVVPGTEEYVEGLQVDEYQRSKIRAVVTKGLGDEEAPTRRLSESKRSSMGGSGKGSSSKGSSSKGSSSKGSSSKDGSSKDGSSKGSKSDMSYSSKGSKSGDGSSKGSKGCYNVCSKGSKGSDGSGKSGKSGDKGSDGSGKSGKSGDKGGSSKGGSSKGDSSKGGSSKGGSSKGGSSKGDKGSSSKGSSSKGDKGGSSKGSKSGAPSVCADCDCGEADRQWLFVAQLGACVFTECGGSCADFIPDSKAEKATCFQYGSQAECCNDRFFGESCKVLDVCPSSSKSGKSSTGKASKSSPTPSPKSSGGTSTYMPTDDGPPEFGTPAPTPGGTTTVAKDAYGGEPTLPPRRA